MTNSDDQIHKLGNNKMNQIKRSITWMTAAAPKLADNGQPIKYKQLYGKQQGEPVAREREAADPMALQLLGSQHMRHVARHRRPKGAEAGIHKEGCASSRQAREQQVRVKRENLKTALEAKAEKSS